MLTLSRWRLDAGQLPEKAIMGLRLGLDVADGRRSCEIIRLILLALTVDLAPPPVILLPACNPTPPPHACSLKEEDLERKLIILGAHRANTFLSNK